MAEDQANAINRLRLALLTYQGGQALLLKAHRKVHRKMNDLPPGEVGTFWAGPGARLKQHVQATAAELVEAFRVFSKAGLVANMEDRHRVTEAQRYLAEVST
jgi:hypothetical protein